MILSILTGIIVGLSCILFGYQVTFRHSPAIAARDINLSGYTLFVMCTYLIILTIGYESYGTGYWETGCVFLLGVFHCFGATAVGVPVLFRAFMIQYQYHNNKSKLDNRDREFYEKFAFCSAAKAKIIVIGIPSIITLPIGLMIRYLRPYTPPTDYSQCFDGYVIAYLAETIPIIIVFAYLIYKFWTFKDPFYIKTELILFLVLGSPEIGLFMGFQLFDTYKQPFWHPVFLQPLLLLWLTVALAALITSAFPIYVARKDYLRLQRIDSSSNMISLDFILENPELLENFEDYVAQHWCSETILFLKEVRHFIRENGNRELAAHIISEFLEEGSKNQINLNDQDRKDILKRFSSGVFDSHLFNSAAGDVQDQLATILLRWKTTQLPSLEFDVKSQTFVPLKPIVP